MHTSRALFCGVALAAAAAGAARAQEASGSGTSLAEIVVTAQKRAENIQDVPISITAVQGERLEREGFATSQDLSRLAPGVSIGTAGGNTATYTYIRGGGTNLIDISADPSVATFIDEVYVPGTNGMQFSLLDIDRIEVLKGPQGTLFGRNAAAGAISIHTRAPSDTFGAEALVEAGNDGLVTGRGSMTGPLTDDKALRFRVAAMFRHRDPVTDNLAGKDPGEINTYGVRGQVMWKGEDVTALATVGYAGANNGPADTFTFTSGFLGALFDNTAPLADHPNRFFKVWRNRDGGYDRQAIWDTNLRLEWNSPVGQVTSISAYRQSRSAGVDDADGSYADALGLFYLEKHKTFSQEIRLANDWSRLKTIAGVYAFHDKGFDNHSYTTYADMALYPVSKGPISDRHALTVDSVAVFGQATYDLTQRLSLTVGARYTHDKKHSDRALDVDAFGPFFLYPEGSFAVAVTKSWSAFNPVATLEYKATDDLMVYGSVRSGYKSGGFQTLLPSTAAIAAQPYDPEKVLSYETGVRSEWFAHRLLVNLSAFHVTTKDQQVSIFQTGALSVRNAARSKADGIDIEIRGRPTDNLTLAWLATAQKARFGAYRYTSPIDGPVDNTGNHQLRSPDFSSSVSADYQAPLANGGSLTLHADYFYQTRVYFNDANYRAQPTTYQSGYGLLGARISYAPPGSQWEFAVWGRNLADTHYCTSIIVWGTPAPGTGTCTPGDPRAYGASVRAKF